jgi:hypothetical protein
MFLFYSGFSINESIRNKGINYTKTLFNKSITIEIIYFISKISNLIFIIFIRKYIHFKK